MRIGALLDLRRSVADVAAELRRLGGQRFELARASPIFGHDAPAVLAVVGTEAPGINLGTAAVPVYCRLP